MPNLMPSDIVVEVEAVMRSANQGKGNSPRFLTAYQILHRLPEATKSRIIAERTIGGAGAGVHYGAPSVVSDAAEMVPHVQISYLDCQDLSISVAGTPITPGYPVCGLYRIE